MSTSTLDLVFRNVPTDRGGAVVEAVNRILDGREAEDAPDNDLAAIEPVLRRANAATRALAEQLAREARRLPAAGEPRPERPEGGGQPRYFRLSKAGSTFGYVWVRETELRINLKLSARAATDLAPAVAARRVKATTRYKHVVYVRGSEDLKAAVAAIRRAHEEAAGG